MPCWSTLLQALRRCLRRIVASWISWICPCSSLRLMMGRLNKWALGWLVRCLGHRQSFARSLHQLVLHVVVSRWALCNATFSHRLIKLDQVCFLDCRCCIRTAAGVCSANFGDLVRFANRRSRSLTIWVWLLRIEYACRILRGTFLSGMRIIWSTWGTRHSRLLNCRQMILHGCLRRLKSVAKSWISRNFAQHVRHVRLAVGTNSSFVRNWLRNVMGGSFRNANFFLQRRTMESLRS